MNLYELSSSGSILTYKTDKYDGLHPLDPAIFRISSNGEYFLTCGSGAVYSTAMVYKGAIGWGHDFNDFAFSKDCNTIYGGTSYEGRRGPPSIQFIKYPELTKTREYFTSGYSIFLFYYNGEIVSISVPSSYGSNNSNGRYFIFERIKVE